MADTPLNKLLQKTDAVQKQNDTLEQIRSELFDLNGKIRNLNRDDKNRIEELKEQIKLIQKEGSLKQQKALNDTLKMVRGDIASVSEDIKDFTSDVRLDFISLNQEFAEVQAETQLLMEEKLKEIGEFVGEKIDIAVKFIGSAIKNAVTNISNYIDNKITYLLNNITSIMKGAFNTLKNAILRPIEMLRNLPGMILDKMKSAVMFVFNTIKSFITGAIKFAFNFVIGAIKFAFKAVIGVIKGVIWVFTKVFEGLYFLVKSAFKIIYFIASKILSFVVGVVWSLIKTVGKFVLNVLWTSVKLIATSVAKVLWTITKTLVQTIVIAITSAFAPWLGLLALIGVGIYFLGRYFGWWGNQDSKPSEVSKGGFWGGLTDTVGSWLQSIGEYFWAKDGKSGVLQKAFHWFWNDENTGVIQKFFGISGKFADWIWNKLKEFWDWVLKGAKTSDPFEIREEQMSKIEKALERINSSQTDLMERQKDYTNELNVLNKISNPTQQDIKRKNDLSVAIKEIKIKITDLDKEKTEVKQKGDEIKTNTSDKIKLLAPIFSDLVKNDKVAEIISNYLGNTYDYLEGNEALTTKDLTEITNQISDEFKNAKTEADKQNLGIALNAVKDYQKNAEDVVGRKSGIIENMIDAVKGWWNETGKTSLYAFIFGDSTVAGSKGIIPLVVEKVKDIWNKIANYIHGEGKDWTNPSSDSLLGKFYEIIFGKTTIDWGTAGGLIGVMKEISYSYIVNPIIGFIQDFFEPFVKNVFRFLGKILSWVSQDAAEKTQNVGRGISEAMSGAATKAAASGAAFMGEREKFLKEQIASSKNVEEASDLVKSLSSVQESQKSFISKIKEAYIVSPEEKLKKQKSLVGNYTYFLKYLYSLGINDPQKSNDWLVASTSIKEKSKNLLNNDVDLVKTGASEFFNLDTGIGFDLKTIKGFYQDIIDGNQPYKKEQFNSFKKEMFDAATQGYISSDVANSFSTILTNINLIQNGIKKSYDMSLIEAKKNNVPGIWSNAKNDEDLTESVKTDILSNLTDEYRTHFIGFSKIYKWIGEDVGNVETAFGFAKGGIIKPPTMESDKGRIINVAEAGNPEIVVPLTNDGLTYIKQISETIQPVESEKQKETNNKKEEPIIKKEDSNQTITNIAFPYIAAKEIERSDKTELDIIRLVSLGVLTK